MHVLYCIFIFQYVPNEDATPEAMAELAKNVRYDILRVTYLDM